MNVGQVHVSPHHLEGGVSEDALEGEGVAAIDEVVDSEGVAEQVPVEAVDAASSGDAPGHRHHRALGEGTAVPPKEDVVVLRQGRLGPEVEQLALKRPGCRVAEGDDALLGALAERPQESLIEV